MKGSSIQESEGVLGERLRALLSALERNRALGTPNPMLAAELAEACGYHGGHEHKRRRIRELVDELHGQGHRICSSSGAPEDCGYWIARNDQEWGAFRAAKKSEGKFKFARLAVMARAANEKQSGQGRLFAAADTAWARA